MTPVTCEDVRQRLDAFHDQELDLAGQIAIQKHVHECAACAAELNELRTLGMALLSSARPRQVTLSAEESVGFQNDILTRIKTERSLSFATSVRTMFEDMRLVYAGMGASMSAMAFVLMLLNMTQLFADDRPNSLAAQMHTLAARSLPAASSAPMPVMPVVTDAKLLAASSFGPIVAADSDLMMRDSDAEYSLDVVVTREGRVNDVELLHAKSGQPVADPEVAVFFRPLVRAVSRARFEPASVGGLPVASSLVLNVPHTTVRPAKAAVASAVPGKKSITLGTVTARPARA
jgi:hypothetical protein